MTHFSRESAKFWWGVDLPREIAYLYKDSMRNHLYLDETLKFWNNTDWIIKTYKEIIDAKTENQLNNLERNRRYIVTKPCYVWVFYNKSWIMGGWWLYIITIKKDYALNFREERNDLIEKCMRLFPCGVFPFAENMDIWMELFAKQYPHNNGFRTNKKQGLRKAHCTLDECNKLIDIIP